MTGYLVVFLAGLAGSFHCIGMCGGFACALGGDPRGRAATVSRHLAYNLGRLATYVFLGALVGAAAAAICTASGSLDQSIVAGQRALTVVAGLLMMVMALQFFGLLQHRRGTVLGFAGSSLSLSLGSLQTASGPAAPLALGVINGFLPCPLVYAFVAKAASTAGPAPAALTMLAFGLGTFPAMLAMGGVGRLLGPAWRRRGVWLAGAFILVLGLLTVARGFLPPAGHGLH